MQSVIKDDVDMFGHPLHSTGNTKPKLTILLSQNTKHHFFLKMDGHHISPRNLPY